MNPETEHEKYMREWGEKLAELQKHGTPLDPKNLGDAPRRYKDGDAIVFAPIPPRTAQ